MLENLFEECSNQWAQVKNSKKHAFRFFTLATIASDGRPHMLKRHKKKRNHRKD